MHSFVGRVQNKESYLLRLFQANGDARCARRPLSARVREKRERRLELKKAGVNVRVDEAISNWSEQDDCHVEELLPRHEAACCRLPDLGAVSVNPAWVPTVRERRVSLAERSVLAADAGAGPSVSGMVKVNKKRVQTGK